LAVVVPDPAPLNVTVAPFPPAAGVIVPEMLKVLVCAVAVKLIPVTLAPLTVALWLAGLKV